MQVNGYEPSHDSQLHADVLYRHAGSADVVIASADSTNVVNPDLGVYSPGDISADVHGDAVPAKDGDFLVLHVQMTAGTTDYIELGTGLTLP